MFMIQLEDINQYFSEFLTTYPLSNGSNSHFKQLRKDAAEQFRQQGLPDRSNEMWREMKWDFITRNKKYVIQTEPKAYQPVENYFQCSTEDINADMFTFLNG